MSVSISHGLNIHFLYDHQLYFKRIMEFGIH